MVEEKSVGNMVAVSEWVGAWVVCFVVVYCLICVFLLSY